MATDATKKSALESAANVQDREALFAEQSGVWRDPAQICSQWLEAQHVDERLLDFTVTGGWWDVLERLKITLLVSREYEHLLLGLSNHKMPSTTFMPMPHPSGIAVDRKKSLVHVASTRNPNQIFTLKAATGAIERLDLTPNEQTSDLSTNESRPLLSVRSLYFPGSLYLHDLAMIDGHLHANAVGQNAVIKIKSDGSYKQVWWPNCIEVDEKPVFGQNHIQLNSIAAGDSIKKSFFSASSESIADIRPGHADYPVDKRGVIFSGKTGERIAGGLTRPHSARLLPDAAFSDKKLWVDNSGYGEFGYIDDGKFHSVIKLPGWTRGLSFCKDVAFVGTSRVIPRFAQYAPGLDVNASICAVHAIDIKSGEVLGSISWEYGNQIFAIDWLPAKQSAGFPFSRENSRDTRSLFYSFKI